MVNLEMVGGMQMDLLWTNPSPTSSFSATTIEIDLSKYNAVLILSNWFTNSQVTESLFLPVGVTGRISASIQLMSFRDTTVSETGVIFGSGQSFTSYNGPFSQDDTKSIPVRIYGIKF